MESRTVPRGGWDNPAERGGSGRSRFWSQGWRVVAVAIAVLPAGCNLPTHQKSRMTAEAQWGEVRSRIKLQLARQQFERGRPEEAVALAEEAIALDPREAEAFILLARCHLADGKLNAASRAIEQAARLKSRNAELSYVRGMVSERMGRLDDALLSFREARTLDDTHLSYLVSEAECLATLGRAAEALALLEENLVNFDSDPTIHALIGEISLRMGDLDAARRAFGLVLASGHDDPLIVEEYALLAVRSGRHEEALGVLEPLIARDFQAARPSIVRATASCLMAVGRCGQAKAHLRRLLEREPDDTEAWALLAQAGLGANDPATVVQAGANLRRLAPSSPEPLLLEAYAAIRQDRLDKATELLAKLLALNEEDVLAHCMLGMAAEKLRNWSGARRHYHRALELDPDCELAQSGLRRSTM